MSVLLQDIGINVSQFQATRMGKENKDKRRPILVEFANIWDRRRVHAARTKLKSRGYKGIYINEDLTKEQAEIFYYARQAKKKNFDPQYMDNRRPDFCIKTKARQHGNKCAGPFCSKTAGAHTKPENATEKGHWTANRTSSQIYYNN